MGLRQQVEVYVFGFLVFQKMWVWVSFLERPIYLAAATVTPDASKHHVAPIHWTRSRLAATCVANTAEIISNFAQTEKKNINFILDNQQQTIKQ